jgi:hypothetical protein
MKEILLRDEKWGKNEHHILKALVKQNGDLVFEGVDTGDSVKERFGDFDYEYWYTVNAKNVHDVLLHLLKEKFHTISACLNWLKSKEIPYKTVSY